MTINDDELGKEKPRTLSKTPYYEGIHSARYRRQDAIKTIETNSGRVVVCYVSGVSASVDREDILAFSDLLHNMPRGRDVDLVLHTGGGDTNAAEKLMSLLRLAVGEAMLRIIVPDFAKSAGTLMALAGDTVVMSDSSELGPIDPQVGYIDSRGNFVSEAVQTYIDAYETHASALRANPNDPVAHLMLSKLDPARLKLFEAAKTHARSLAESHLRKFMFHGKDHIGNVTKIAADLVDTQRWLNHGQVISWQDAQQLGIEVTYLEPANHEWQAYWRLYCLQRLAIRDGEKLFESGAASHVVEGRS